VENGEHGSRTAAPIARKVIDSYLMGFQQDSKPTATARLASGFSNPAESN